MSYQRFLYEKTRKEIEDLVKTKDVDEMKKIHRGLEVYNAHALVEKREDKVLKDIQFLLQSAIVLNDIGQKNDWKIQLETAIHILNSVIGKE